MLGCDEKPTATMTMYYLSGEISVWLGELAPLIADPSAAARVAELRIRSERCAPHELTSLVPRMLDVIDEVCWSSLANGNITGFDRQSAVARGLAEFSRAAGILHDDQS
jgi:hypothetical protein